MRSWKFVLAGIIVAYLIIASAISIAADYLASTPRSLFGQQESSFAEIGFFSEPDCMIAQDTSPTRIAPPTAKTAIGSHPLFWNFKGPDDVVSYGPLLSCDDYAS
jgi:hypothetical protein